MSRLEARPEPSRAMMLASPLIAAGAMLLTGSLLFLFLGHAPLHAFYVYFIQPCTSLYGIGELLLKATPLILCGVGLAIGFRANVHNIGADGQLTMGAVAAGCVALYFDGVNAPWLLPLMLVAGALGGMAWAAVPALLRTRFNTNEIMVSLMLVYVAYLFLGYLVHGPLRDPAGFNFPQSKMFGDAAMLPLLKEGLRVNAAFPLSLVAVAGAWFFCRHSFAGYRMRVSGMAPAAALYAGFSEPKNVWIAFLASGGLAGLAGVGEVAGPLGQLQASVSPGYGFAAIIVAYVGRLHPAGVLLASLLMSLLYIGGETAQVELQLPSAITGLFQGLLLFYLLAADLFIHYRIKPRHAALAVKPAPAASTLTETVQHES
ncbi:MULTISPECIES: ABC transporter permease [unclassified Pseudomonas]|uniref:ABC transporter permease n=1 Tax=unclassified Pseudomonas TaxID=196821 RepID=UPI00000B04AE|nr:MULTISPECIES: ABC transporter permease [unclassified Pseudomonas]AAK50326.1 putative permease from ABC transporter [Pseudomonas sp. ADP]KSW21357.1 sugar ABC transporter permease [Pseudomonas sp. ADP]OBP12137.1 sugar ABC transporter permease [Pseudomonas sp. EGD-AKN5]QOF88441.1 ABC transporter permease [Pseudomonas sp. ADPe]